MKYIKVGFVAIAGLLVLGACSSEEDEKIQQAKQDFNVLYSYDESKILPVINEEKTSEELAQDYLEDKIGMNSNSEDTEYQEQGVKEEQGVFIESAIYEGNEIPNVTAMSDETRERLENDREDKSLEQREEDYEELKKERQSVIEEQYAEDNQNKDQVEEEIQNRVEEYEQDKDEDEENGTNEEGNENDEDVEGNDEQNEEDFEYEDDSQNNGGLFDE